MRRSHLLVASSLVALLSTPVFAQDKAAADGTKSDENTIIVTARQRSENLLDVPIAVSVATAEQLKRDKVYSISDLQRITPALEISQSNGGEVNGGARVRGLGTGVFNASVSPSIAFVVDQVAQGNLTFPILHDLAQVEVLRGPQGTLFGQGASAGVVNVTTANPSLSGIKASAAIDLAGKGTAGSEVTETVGRAAFNLPLGQRVALRVAGYYKREKGLQRNTFLNLDNVIKDYAFRGKLLIEASDAVTINLSAETAKQSMLGWNFFAVANTPTLAASLAAYTAPAPNGCNVQTFTARAEFYCEDSQTHMENKTNAFSGRIDAKLNDSLTLTSITAYRNLTRQIYSVNYSRRIGVAARLENQQDKSNQFSQELRLAYKGDRLDLIAGAYYSKYNLETTPIDASLGFGNVALGKRTGFSVCFFSGVSPVPNVVPVCPGAPVALSYEKTRNETKAFFADGTYKLSDQVSMFGGLRFTSYSNTTGTASNAVVATNTAVATDKNLSGRVGFSYKPNATTNIYISYSKGYKPKALVVPTIAGGAVTRLKPENADSIELGAKFQLDRVQLSGNIFYTKIKNFQQQSQTFVGASLVSVTSNIPSVESKGFEINAFGKLSDHFSLNAGYQFNDVKYPAGYFGNDKISLAGTQFVNAPKHKFTLSADLGVPVSSGVEAFLNTNIVYKSKTLLGQYGADKYRYPAHATINLSLGVRDPDNKWRASIFARNLTKQREPIAYLTGDSSGADDGSVRAWPVAGLTARVMGLALEYSY